MKLLRAFIAIEIPTEIQDVISGETASLRKQAGRAVRWVTPGNFHLTLKFLGEVPAADVAPLSQALQEVCSAASPFEIMIQSLGAFPNPNRARVIWVGLEFPPHLTQLQSKVDAATTRLGYASEDRPFSAHLTIGRVREQAGPEELTNLRAALSSLHIARFGAFNVHHVTLFKSDLQPAGPQYTPLSNAHLGN